MWYHIAPRCIKDPRMWIHTGPMWIEPPPNWFKMYHARFDTAALLFNIPPMWIDSAALCFNIAAMWFKNEAVWIEKSAPLIDNPSLWIGIRGSLYRSGAGTNALGSKQDKAFRRCTPFPRSYHPLLNIIATDDTSTGPFADKGPHRNSPVHKTQKRMEPFFVVKTGLTALTSKALVEKGRNCVDMLTGNASFTLPAGFLANLTTACDTLEQANEEVLFFGGKVNHQAKRVAEAAVRDILRELAGLVQQQSGGNEGKILSAGFDVRRKGTPVDKLSTVENLRPVLTPFSNQVVLRWNNERHASNYEVFINRVDPSKEENWERVAFTSRATCTVDGLESARHYWFRVQAIGRKGLMSPMSQIIKVLAA